MPWTGAREDGSPGIVQQILDPCDGEVEGTAGPDLLHGHHAWEDEISGWAGADTLLGLAGVDLLTGGAGADTFLFLRPADSPPGGVDQVADFLRGTDRISLAAMDANPLLAGNQAFVLDAGGAFTLGELRRSGRERTCFSKPTSTPIRRPNRSSSFST